MNNIGPTFVIVVGGVISLAMVAVVVSKNAQTATVIQGAGSALSSIIGAAVQPVSGTAGSTFGSTTATGGVTT
jgi:hypothetical protein